MDERFSDMIEDSARGSLVLILGQMASTFISSLGVIFVARFLGSTSFGVLSIAVIPVQFALLLITNGVSSAMINFIVEDRHLGEGKNLGSIVLSGFVVNLTAGFLATLLLFLSAGYLASDVFSRPELTLLIKILSITTFSQALFDAVGAVLVGYERMSHMSLLSIAFSILKSIVSPVLVYLGFGVVGAAIGYGTPILLSGLLGLLIISNNLKHIVLMDIDISYIRRIISYSSPIFVSTLLSGIFIQVLTFILPLYASTRQIGNYYAANNFSVLITFFLTPITTATFPLLSKLKPADSVFERVYHNIIKYESFVAFPIAAVIIALADRMVMILFGQDYYEAIIYIQILMVNYFFLGIGSTVSLTLLNSQKRTDVLLRRTLIYLLIGAPMGFFLIPRLGVIGLQVTTIIAPKFGLMYVLWWMRKNLDISLDVISTAKIAVSTFFGYLTCITVLQVFESNIWAELILGGVSFLAVYIISILVSGALTVMNISDIKKISDKNKQIKPFIDPILNLMIKIARN